MERVVLGSLAAIGIGLMAIAAPNTVKLLKQIDPQWLGKPDPKQRLRETASKLRRKGFVQYVQEDGHTRMRITAKGREYLERLSLSGLRISPRKWDGKWRLVIFDIPERKRHLRNTVRSMVVTFGFVQLQQSVWAYPHDCEELISLLKARLRIGTEVLYIIADAIEYDKPLRQHFCLPRD